MAAAWGFTRTRDVLTCIARPGVEQETASKNLQNNERRLWLYIDIEMAVSLSIGTTELTSALSREVLNA